MKIGITGARGLVGKVLAARLRKQGHDLVLYTRAVEGRWEELESAEELRHFSPEVAGDTDVSGLHALIHLAGEPVLEVWTAAKKEQIRASRIDGTAGLVAAMEACDAAPKVFVTASGTGFYGDRGDEVLTEESEHGEGFLSEVSQAWEAEAMRAQALGIRVVCGRIGMVLGSEGGAAPKLKTLFRWGLGGQLGSGKQWMPWVHVEDVAQMFIHAVEQESLVGAVNFCAPEAVRNKDFTKALARQVKRPALAWVPAPVLKLVMGGLSDLVLMSERVESVSLRESGFEWSYADLQAALAEVMA
ncbi:MAG: TIGR01777 family oxidoreductase [Verrucomicrobiales bacterium]|nr:TIGR01777 family oxidoreductase [Verrucomicrobiales bacterium]